MFKGPKNKSANYYARVFPISCSTDYDPDHECPKFPIDVVAPLKTNPSYGINASLAQIAPENLLAGTYMSPREFGPPEKKRKEDEEDEDHTYEPIPFDYPGH